MEEGACVGVMGVCVVRCVLGLGLNWPGGRGGWVLGWFVPFGLGVGCTGCFGGLVVGLGVLCWVGCGAGVGRVWGALW